MKEFIIGFIVSFIFLLGILFAAGIIYLLLVGIIYLFIEGHAVWGIITVVVIFCTIGGIMKIFAEDEGE